jgi:hypothetical protein
VHHPSHLSWQPGAATCFDPAVNGCERGGLVTSFALVEPSARLGSTGYPLPRSGWLCLRMYSTNLPAALVATALGEPGRKICAVEAAVAASLVVQLPGRSIVATWLVDLMAASG